MAASLACKVARKHLGWYLDEAGLPHARDAILTATDPAEVIRAAANRPSPSWSWPHDALPRALSGARRHLGLAAVAGAADRRAGLILEVNPAAETFLNASAAALRGQPAFDRLSIDAPMEEALARARANQSPLFINDVDVTTGERPPVQCTIQLAPMHDNPDIVMLILSPARDRRSAGPRRCRSNIGRQIRHRHGRNAGA